MAQWASRSPSYMVGMVGIILFSVLYLVGFSSPFWIVEYSRLGTGKITVGLWMLCISSTWPRPEYCDYLDTKKLDTWFHVARGFSIVGCMVLLGTCISGIISNCRSFDPAHSRRLEIMGIIGGILTFIGAVVFVGKHEELVPVLFINSKVSMSWAFYLAAIGSTGALAASLLVTVNNAPVCLPQAQNVPPMRRAVSAWGLPPQHRTGGPHILPSGRVHQSFSAYPAGSAVRHSRPSASVYHVPLPRQAHRKPDHTFML